jgi:DNA polymerase I
MASFRLIALAKKSHQQGYWLMDLVDHTVKDFHNTAEEQDFLARNLTVFVDAQSAFLSLELLPSPAWRIICLNTIKKLIAKSVHETASAPDFDSGKSALAWFNQALGTAFSHIDKLEMTALADLECRVVVSTIAMESMGIPFNQDKWRIALSQFAKESSVIKERLTGLLVKPNGFLLFGPEPIDLNNHQAVKAALETVLGQKLSSTGQSSLKDIDHEAAKLVMQYREHSRMESAYGEDFLKKIHDGRIRGHFTPISSASGRFSCHDPNLLALPNHPQFQACIEPAPGRQIIHFDYGAFELRILAALSQDEVLIDIFSRNQDIHSMVASAVFNTEVSKTTNIHLRDQAKVLNFGIIYGMGEHALAKQLKITMTEAKSLLHNYFKRFNKVHTFLSSLETHAQQYGYVKTALGRRGYIDDGQEDKGYGSRIARNLPIQGTGADIVKLAMCRVYKRLHSENPKAHLINLVHDELVVECPQGEATKVSAMVKQEMEQAFLAVLPEVPAEVSVKGSLI